MINIVVTCWDALDYTKATLGSLFNTVHRPYYLTIVDNHSTDGTYKYLDSLRVPENCYGYHVVHNSKNLGPGHACNQGFEYSNKLGVEYTCFCNNDLFFQDNWLGTLEDCMRSDNNIAMVVPLRPSTRVMYDSELSSIDRLKQLGLYDNWREELEQYMLKPCSQFDIFARHMVETNGGGIEYAKCPPDAFSSCCLLIRNSAFIDDGYFADPRYKNYGAEDMDATWSVAQKGYSVIYCKDVYVHHFRGKSIGSNKIDRSKIIMENNKIFYKKWKPLIKNFINNLTLAGVDINECLSGDKGDKYWFINRLNRDIKFWHDGQFDDSAG